MAQEIEKLNALSIVWDKDSHLYKIANDVVEEVKKFIEENTSIEVQNLNATTGEIEISYEKIEKIDNDNLNKIVWKKRTNLNNKKKEIETKRKQAVAIMINGFVDYCKALESQLDQASKSLTAMINEYKPKDETQKAVTYKLVIKTDSLFVKKKLEEIALQMGAEVSE